MRNEARAEISRSSIYDTMGALEVMRKKDTMVKLVEKLHDLVVAFNPKNPEHLKSMKPYLGLLVTLWEKGQVHEFRAEQYKITNPDGGMGQLDLTEEETIEAAAFFKRLMMDREDGSLKEIMADGIAS